MFGFDNKIQVEDRNTIKKKQVYRRTAYCSSEIGLHSKLVLPFGVRGFFVNFHWIITVHYQKSIIHLIIYLKV